MHIFMCAACNVCVSYKRKEPPPRHKIEQSFSSLTSQPRSSAHGHPIGIGIGSSWHSRPLPGKQARQASPCMDLLSDVLRLHHHAPIKSVACSYVWHITLTIML